MVKIQKLVLKNFKSFKNAEIPIADGFTVIAGSNGSGKTNILDAMLFAMGITSLKMLRASRLTDLVNNSAIENYAKVELHLKHDGKKYEISRMIDKQGKSIYRLNGNRVTLNEISSLLGELGIKPLGHNIVMQGDVTRVIEMSPEERRRIIDELAGLQEFDEKKEEAMKNLGKVDSKIRETTIVLQERENYLQDLEKDKEAALLFESLKKEKRQLKATLLSAEIDKIKGQLKENNGRARESSAKRDELQGKVAELEQGIRAGKEKARQLNESILAANEKIFATVGAKLEEKRSAIKVNEERLERKQELVARNKSKAEQLNEKTRELEQEKRQLQGEKVSVEAKLPQLEKEISALQKQRNETEKAYSGKQGEMQNIEAMVRELSQKIDLLKQEEISKQGEAENIRRRQGIEREKIQELSKEKETLQANISGLEKKQGLLEAVYAREKQPIAALEKSRNVFEKNLGESKRKQALIGSLDEKAVLLQKQIAECPVCESPLEEDKRKKILGKTMEKIKEESLELARLLEKDKDIRKRVEEKEDLVFREQELLLALKALPIERQKNKAIEEKIRLAKAALGAKTFAVIENEARKAREHANSLAVQKERLESKRNELIDRLQLNELNKLNSLLGKAVRDKSLSEQRLEQIEIALTSRIERESKLLLNETKALKSENLTLEEEISQYREKASALEKEVKGLEATQGKAEEENRAEVRKRDRLEEELEKMSEMVSSLQQKIKGLEQNETRLSVESSGMGVRLADLGEEFEEFKGEKLLKEFKEDEARKKLGEIEKQIVGLGAINMRAIESFQELADEVNDVSGKVEKLEEERLAVLGMIEKIEVKRTNVFMDCFRELSRHFSETFFTLFSGEGLLSLSNVEEPLESGLIIEARHKGNSLQNIDSMSGGEKTLTALAFLFAIQLYEPAPFYVFDEADAALDKENSMKMVNIIKETSKKSQFIAITHNDPLIKEADQIIGVALNKQKSSVIGLKLRETVIRAGEQQGVS